MIRYKILEKYYKEIFTYRNRRVADTEHSIARFNERFPHLKLSAWKRIVAKGIDTILDVFNDATGKYIIVSKKTDVAVQLHWRKDNKNDDGFNHGYSATTLNRYDHDKTLKMDTKVFVEEIKKYGLENCFLSESYEDMVKEKNYYIDVKLNEECPDYKIYMKEGKIYRNFEIIEVE